MSDMRYDFARLDGVERTPSGGLRIPAALTRTGVLVYKFKDGTERRELRLPEHVFHKDSLKTLKDAPVTDLHPPEMVTAANHGKYSKGHVSDVNQDDGKHIQATLAVQDGDLISKIDAKDRQEISMGYRTDLIWNAGEYEGEKYDAIQTNIRYNHVAIGPANWGRAGSTVALRLDSCDAFSEPDIGQEPRKQVTMLIRIDGVEYERGSDAHIAKVNADCATQIAAKQALLDTATGRIDGLTAELTDVKAKLVTANDPKRIDSLVAERVSLEGKARGLLGPDVKLDGKSEREIMCEVLELDANDIKDKSDDYLRGRFDTAVTKGASGPSARDDIRSVGNMLRIAAGAGGGAPAAVRTDDNQDNGDDQRADANKSQRRMRQDNNNAGIKPLPGAIVK